MSGFGRSRSLGNSSYCPVGGPIVSLNTFVFKVYICVFLIFKALDMVNQACLIKGEVKSSSKTA